MTQKYTPLELSILRYMRTSLELVLANRLIDSEDELASKVAVDNFHATVNKETACNPGELAVTANMLAAEGLLSPMFNDKTGKEEGYVISQEGLVALRSAS